MGDPSGPIEENGGQNGDTEGPSSLIGMGPPSPLTGCYLLIILGEPHSAEHKDIILQRLVKGFLSWDALQTHVDLEEELNTITVHAPEGEDARHGERLIQYASENLVTEILIHPQYNTLIQCMRNLLSSFTRHRHIIHAGYTFSGNGSWILQDGTFSVSDFAEAFQEHEVQRVLRAYPDTVSMDIHCDSSAGLWNVLPDKNYAKTCKIRINPVDVLESGSDRIKAFIDYLAPMLNPANLNDLLESSDVVGNIRFSHPTLYVFPGGQGDAALFGINGFNMLVDGGFNRKACFWNFARHLDRLDAVLMTRINNSNIQGISSVIERKHNSHVYPGIGHFFCNIPERRAISSPEENKDKDSLVIDLFDKGQKMISNLKSINLKPQMCYRDIEPMNLYHKVGHGTLDMYVISPGKDSREVKDFIQKWTTNDQKLFTAKDTKDFQFPIQNLVSICALLVWQPANPEDSITRILFPGSTPDYKIIEGLEKIKHLEFMKHPMCTAKKLVPSISTATITKKVLKSAINEKSIPEPILPSKTTKAEKDNQVIDNKVKNIQDNKAKESKLIEEQTAEKKVPIKSKPKKIIPKKADSLDEKQKDDIIENKDKDEESVNKPEVVINGSDINDMEKKDETDATAKPKKIDQKTRAPIKSRIDSKPPKSMDKKPIKRDSSEKKEVGKSSPTTTPKKTSSDPKLTNGVPKEKEIKPKIVSRVTKSSPSSTPAKSTKEANNRKVLESKQKAKTIKREIVKTVEKKDEKIERKPISHRTKGISPSRRPPDSPKKSIKPKTEKDNIIRKAKLDKGGTTDSSLVSTPSADDALISKKIIEVAGVDDVVKQRELDDLKEEQEAVREIEEVFKREEKSKKKDLSSDHREVTKQDSATEAEDDEEYLIIEKEEVEQYTEDSINEQESSMTKEEEIQKHQRDSQESEKKLRKPSLQTTEEEVLKSEKDITEMIPDLSGEELERKLSCASARLVDENVPVLDEKHVEITEPENDIDDVQPDSIEEVAGANKLEPEQQQHIKEEVQEIISSAKEIAKTKSDSKEEVAKTEEISSVTPEDKLSSEKKTSDTKDDLDPAQPAKDGEVQNLPESQPFSATVESGATTAPTLPEDERIPLDEIKEDLVVEEKYIKEETKETKEPEMPTSSVLQKTYEPLERIVPTKMQFDTTQPHLRDIVKTPDEVADLPVHEEADIATYEGSEEAKDDKKTIETKSSDDDAKHHVEGGTCDADNVEKKLKIEKMPNGSVINKAENDKIEEKEVDEAVVHLEEKPTFEKSFDKKLDVTGFKEKDSTMAEKVEYAVEDLGKSFENTLKDVTHKDTDKIQGENVKEIVTKDLVEQAEQEPTVESIKLTEEEIEIKEAKTLTDVQEVIRASNESATEVDDDTQKEKPKDLIDIVDETVAGVSSFIVSVAKDITEKVESLVEATKVEEESVIESKDISATDKDQLEFKEVFDYSHPYGLKNFPTELRETHITTLDSPVAEKDKIIDLKILDKLPEAIDEEHDDLSGQSMVPPFHPDDFKYASFEREDSNLKDIKEEEEDDRSTPNDQAASRKESTEISDLTNKDTITVIGLDEQPPRAVSPREEEVLKIVANVAEVLKSEKDIAEIIPDFSEEELERKLRGASPRPDDESVTVQRMLVTASSEDGGEEIEICPEGTIKFSPAATTPEPLSGKATPDVAKDISEVKSECTDNKFDGEGVELSEKENMEIVLEKSDEKEEKETSDSSTPEAKTSSVSIDEKEKHELPEKVQAYDTTNDKLPETANEIVANKSLTESVSRKESVVSDYIDDIMDRRESAFSAFSEKDFTKDESSMDDSRPQSTVSHDLKIEKEDDSTPKTLVVDVTDVERPASVESINEQSPEEKSVISKDEKKQKEEEKSPTLSDLKVEVSDERRESASSHISDKSGVEMSRPDSIISHFSDRSEPELKEKLGSSPDSIASIDKAMAQIKLSDQSVPTKTKEFQTQSGSFDEKEDGDKTPISRPESAASHVSDADKTEEFDTLRASSVTSPKEIKSESNVATPVSIKDDKPSTQPASPVSEKEKTNLQESTSVKSDGRQQDDSRPFSSASHGSDKEETKRPESVTSKLGDKQDASRPPSTTSHISDKEQADLQESASVKSDGQQHDVSRPQSIASHVSDKGEVKLQESESSKLDDKQDDSRPPSIVSEKEEGKRPESETSKLDEKHDSSRAPSVASDVSDKEESKRPESVTSKLDEKHDGSRPPSIVSHVSDKEEAKRPESVISKLSDKKEDSRPPSVVSHLSDKEEVNLQESASVKLDGKQQDDSRPQSIASHVSDKEEDKLQESASSKLSDKNDDSRPPSVVSHISDKQEAKRPESVNSKMDEKHDSSRPPSVASHVSDKEETKLPESDISKLDEKPDGSRPPSIASHDAEKQDEKHDSSRPPSVASHVSDKEEAKRPESETSKMDEKHDSSRPTSVASHVSDKEEVKRPESETSKLDEKQDGCRPPSIASHVSDKDESKRPESVSSKLGDKHDDSRPPSVASHVSEKQEAKRPESVNSKLDEKHDSRPPSVASHVSDKEEAKRPESETSKKDEKHDSSRPISVASHISDNEEVKRPESETSKLDEKQDGSRPPSIASHVSDKDESKRPESVSSKLGDEHDDSRPPSVASHVSEKQEAKRSESENSKLDEKHDSSRPPSIASHASDTEETKLQDSPSIKTDDKQLDDSRPPSIASHVSDKEEAKRPESVSSKLSDKKDDSRPPSVASNVSDKQEANRPQSVSSKLDDKKDDSRPPSVASHVSEKDETKPPQSETSKLEDKQDISRPPSIVSHVSDKDEVKRPESVISKLSDKKDDSRAPSVASNISDKQEEKQPESVTSKLDEELDVTRPSSITSHVSEKEEAKRPESVISKLSDKKDDSRPPSVASNVSDKEETKPPQSVSQDVSRPPSTDSRVSNKEEINLQDSASIKSDGKQPDDSRPQSIASHVSDKQETMRSESVSSKLDEKEDDSRPPSVASHISDKEEVKRPASVSSKLGDKKDESRPPSIASHVSDEEEIKRPESVNSKLDEKHDSSRPPSIASHVIDTEETKLQDSTSIKSDGKQQDDSRPPSIASHVSDKEEVKRPESVSSKLSDKKGDSRPPSVASHISDKEEAMPESITSKLSDKQDSRPPSNTSHVSDKEEVKRPESVSSKLEDKPDDCRPHSAASHVSDKEEAERPESVSSKLGERKDECRPPSIVSHISDKEETNRPESVSSKLDDKKDDSRPPSTHSHVSDKEEVNLQDSASVKSDGKQKDDSRPQSITSYVSDKDETKRPESVSSKLSDKQHDSRPPSVASHISDKEEDKRPESITSKLSDKLDSRPPSVISHVSDKEEAKQPESETSKLEEKYDNSRPPSIASHVSDTEETKLQDSTSIKTDGKQQDDSRPPSIASHVSDKEEAKRPESVSSKLSDKKDDSRPPSVASNVSDKQEANRPQSVSSKLDDKKDDSRPPSVASHVSEKGEAQRPESVISELGEKKDDSRPPSIASHISDKEESNRPESVSSKFDDKKDHSRPPSTDSHVSNKEEVNLQDSASVKSDGKQNEDSRPQSTASHVSDKDEVKRPDSVSSKLYDKQDDSRPPSIVSNVSDIHETKLQDLESVKSDGKQQEDSRPQSIASHVSDIEETKLQDSARVKSDGKQQEDSRPQSIASHVSDKEEITRPESASLKLDDKQDASRPPSIASHVSDKDESKRPESVSSKLGDDKHDESRPPSNASHISDNDETKRQDVKISRPESATSNVDKELVSVVSHTEISSRRESAASHVSDQQVTQISSGPTSASSHKSEDKQQQISRPASVASNESENENSQKLTEDRNQVDDRSGSRQSHDEKFASDTVEKPKDSRSASVVSSVGGVNEKDTHSSRPGSVTSFVSEKEFTPRPTSAASHTSESRNQSRRESAVERCSVDEDDEMEIVKVKDSRSKSVSSIMMTSMYKPEGFEPMTTFQESFDQSKDDSEIVSSSSRKASDLSNLIDDINRIDGKLILSKIEDKTSVSPETEISDKISTETIPSEQSSPTESKMQVKLESMPGSSLEAPKSSAESLSGKSTPDVADIERKFLETSAKTITETVLDSSTAKHEGDVREDNDFDHISTTEKVSKTIEVTSESTIKSSSSTVHTKSTSSSSELQSQSMNKDGAINKDVTSIKSEFRSYTPSSDDFDVHETNSPRSDVSTGHVRLVCGWTGSDDEITNSPLSTTSQAPCSPPSKFTYETEYELQRSSSGVSKKSEFDIDDSEDDVPPEYGSKEVESAIPIHTGYKSDPMETSFYGKLPESEPIPITTSIRTVITKQYDEYTSSEPDSSSCVSHESHESIKTSTDHRFLDEADLDFEKALEEHRQARGSDIMSSVTSKYEFSPSKQTLESAKTTEFPLSGVQKGKSIDSKSDAPTTSEVQTKSDEQIQKEKADERVSSWGKPLGLPSPVPVESQTTPKRERKLMISKTKMNNEKNLRKRSESPIKGKKVTPIYMDLTYVPHNGNSYYSHVEFFKRVRARYYVFSGTEPSRDVYNALLEAKQTWEDKELEVTIIPTYDTDVLGYWVSENEDLLAKYHIDLSPSASRCTINLQDHETSCSAYRLEF